jgi:hypothetical protein
MCASRKQNVEMRIESQPLDELTLELSASWSESVQIASQNDVKLEGSGDVKESVASTWKYVSNNDTLSNGSITKLYRH